MPDFTEGADTVHFAFCRADDGKHRLESGSREARLHSWVWGPQGTLCFGDLLEGLTELRKPIRLMFMVYYRERIQIKNQQRHIGQSPGETSRELLVVLS